MTNTVDPLATVLPECNQPLIVKSETVTGTGIVNATAKVSAVVNFAIMPTNLPCWRDMKATAFDDMSNSQASNAVRLVFDCKRLPNGKCKK